MKIKSYFANSVEIAMAMARDELGPEAMLVNSRKTSPETRHLGAYEVVFVTDLGPGEQAESPIAILPQKPAANDRLTQQMAELKRELQGMRRSITRSTLAPATWRENSP